jgi:hypothetical protein
MKQDMSIDKLKFRCQQIINHWCCPYRIDWLFFIRKSRKIITICI